MYELVYLQDSATTPDSPELQTHKSSTRIYFQFNILNHLLSWIIYSTFLCSICLFILQSFFQL